MYKVSERVAAKAKLSRCAYRLRRLGLDDELVLLKVLECNLHGGGCGGG